MPLKQERRSERTAAGRGTDRFTRRQTDMQCHCAGQGTTVNVDQRRRKDSVIQDQQSPSVAISTSGDFVVGGVGRGQVAVDGAG